MGCEMAVTQQQLDKRMAQERQVVRHLIRTAKQHGYQVVKVDDGEEVHKVSTEKAAMDAVFAVDDSTIRFKHPDEPKSHCAVIVLGNSGPECIADASMGPMWDVVMANVWGYCEEMDVSNG